MLDEVRVWCAECRTDRQTDRRKEHRGHIQHKLMRFSVDFLVFSLRYDCDAFETPKNPTHRMIFCALVLPAKRYCMFLSGPRRVAVEWRLWKSHLPAYAWTDCRPTSVTAAAQPFHWNDLNFRIIAYTRLAEDLTKNTHEKPLLRILELCRRGMGKRVNSVYTQLRFSTCERT